MEASNTTAPTEAPITGSAPLYVRPEPLSFDRHKKLGLKEMNPPWGFAARQHFVPLLAGEFAVAALSYPIIFAGPEYAPLAVMGVNPGENLFFEETGMVRPDAYLPAYIRRYPFTVASDEAMGRMVVCVDVGSKLISENPDFPFFNEKGEVTPYTQRCIDFCQSFDVERQKTEALVKNLRELDLFEHREQTHTPANADGSPGQPIRLAGYNAISETKLLALPDDKFLELKANGALGLIYAHLISLAGWDRLVALAISKANERAAAQAPAAGNA